MLRLKIKCEVKELEELKKELQKLIDFVSVELSSDRVFENYEDDLISIDETLIELDDKIYTITYSSEWSKKNG